MKVDDLIKELEKHKGKKVYVGNMYIKDIKFIEEEEAESSIIYIVTE